jgi:predicted ribosomally synthesized peptide with nif11-like leader
MSRQQAERFFEALEKDPALRLALEAAGIGELGQPLVAFAGVHGFDFTLEELRAHIAGKGAELTDEMLGHVAGGSDELSKDLQNKLQEMMQQYQPSSQMMSNLLKGRSDMEQAVIRKIGG